MIDISTYNGDSTEKYKWSQAFNEVQVQIDIPEGSKSKDLIVDLKPKKIMIRHKSLDEPILAGDLDNPIKAEDSYWTLEDNKRLILNLTKAGEAIWATVVKGDKTIDTKKVDNSKNLSDFDVETQGHLRKVLYEQ